MEEKEAEGEHGGPLRSGGARSPGRGLGSLGTDGEPCLRSTWKLTTEQMLLESSRKANAPMDGPPQLHLLVLNVSRPSQARHPRKARAGTAVGYRCRRGQARHKGTRVKIKLFYSEFGLVLKTGCVFGVGRQNPISLPRQQGLSS